MARQTGGVFDGAFFRTMLPGLIKQHCEGHPESVPVVQLHLADGRALDLCHISHLADGWLAAHFYRDAATCNDMDVALVPYGLVTLVTVALHPTASRRMGFQLEPGRTYR